MRFHETKGLILGGVQVLHKCNLKSRDPFNSVLFLSFNVYPFLRAYEWGRGRERETQNRKQALSCQPRARGGARTPEP